MQSEESDGGCARASGKGTNRAVLVELHVAGLGVIDESRVVFGEGLTALTGETGAGKTLLVDALDLVLGGKPRRGLIRNGQTALIEAVFVDEDGQEVILGREIPSEGRARAWIDGRLASASALEERASGLCDIHGQHEHQSLLGSGAVRKALDTFAEIDVSSLREARAVVRSLDAEGASFGGDAMDVAREIALLEHQLAEIDSAGVKLPGELDQLLEQVRTLEGAGELRRELERGLDVLENEGSGPHDQLAEVRKAIEGYAALRDVAQSILGAEVALEELATELRHAAERIEEDPARLAEANERLGVLHQLCRRYGPSISDVLERREGFVEELVRLRESEALRESFDARYRVALERRDDEERTVEGLRQSAAPQMVEVLKEKLARLALERSSIEISLSGPAGDDVELLFSANPGLAPQPVARVASGGELARLMLAIRLIMPGGPSTMVFDEVDAGVGGATAVTLAEALRDVSHDRQVLVVTHLAQVAAVADHQIGVVKQPGHDSTSATALMITGEDRVSEIARMLSGQPESETARRHAEELLG